MSDAGRFIWKQTKSQLRKFIVASQRQLSPSSDRFLKACSRVIHVGANVGQERGIYDKYGLSVVWVEPIPAIYAELIRNIQPYPKQTAVQAILTDKVGDRVNFNIASNSGESSSIFDLALHTDIWPEVNYVAKIELQTNTLDHLIIERGLDGPVDALILDTQGSELLVLKGAE